MTDEQTTPATETVRPLVPKRSRSTLIAIVALILAWGIAMYYRNALRATWWSYRLTAAESIEERDYYVVRLASLQDTALVGLSRVLTDPQPETRSAGIRILHYCQSPRAIPYLVDRLDDVSDQVASRATVELVRRGQDELVLARLRVLITQGETVSVRSAAAALARIGGTEAETLLIDALQRRSDADTCAQIIDSLALLECRRAIPLIEAHSDDNRPLTALPASYRAAQAAIEHLRGELIARQADPDGLLKTMQIEPTVAGVARRAAELLRRSDTQPATRQALP